MIIGFTQEKKTEAGPVFQTSVIAPKGPLASRKLDSLWMCGTGSVEPSVRWIFADFGCQLRRWILSLSNPSNTRLWGSPSFLPISVTRCSRSIARVRTRTL